MSVVGHSLPNRAYWAMSGLPLGATELRTSGFGSFVPIATVLTAATGFASRSLRRRV
jgi:hypothetical protein